MDKGKSSGLKDRSKVRILLCDMNMESCQEIQALLSNWSYQAAVWSPFEVVGTLNSQGPRADIILASVDVLMENEAHIMRYIMWKKDLQKIPVIVMTTQDQISVTINAMKLGAVDYLMKPLCANMLSALWMHKL